MEKLNYPFVVGPRLFTECKGFKSDKPEIRKYEICEALTINTCPFAIGNACDVGSEFVNNKLRKTVFTYQYRQFNWDALKSALDKMFGYSDVKETSAPELPTKSWSAQWRDGNVSIRMFRTQGVNIYGKLYNDVQVMFIDTTIIDPLGK
ncbi:hypothetical protein [Fluviibacter phosphoraccumulans]